MPNSLPRAYYALMKCVAALGVLVLGVVLNSVQAQSPDDQYVRIDNLLQQADALNKEGQFSLALQQYLDAQTDLQRLQQIFPEWNPKVVNFRLAYVEEKISGLRSSVSVPVAVSQPARVNQPAQPPVSGIDQKLANMENEIRLLRADKTILEAELKEALATQPAAIDPRELAKAQQRIEELMKENELLKVSLSKPSIENAQATDQKTLEEAKKALIKANRELAAQREATSKLATVKEALELRLKAVVADAQVADALRSENTLLKKQVAELKTIAEGKSSAHENELSQMQTRLATLQSDADILRLEKTALQDRIKQASTAREQSANRNKQLERKLEDMRNQLADAQKGGSTGSGNAADAAKVKELSKLVESLKSRLAVLEAGAVSYAPEELALLNNTSEAKPPVATTRSASASSEKPPPGAAALVTEAQRYFAARQYDKAEEKYLEILRHDESNVYTLANLASVEVETGHLDEAEKHVTQALNSAPNDAYSLSILGYLRLRQEKYDAAFEALSRAAELDPQNPEIQNYLGVILRHKGMRSAAETAFRKALQLQPDYASAHSNLAVLYASQQPPWLGLARWHYQKALAAGYPRNEELEKILQQTPTNAAPVSQ